MQIKEIIVVLYLKLNNKLDRKKIKEHQLLLSYMTNCTSCKYYKRS